MIIRRYIYIYKYTSSIYFYAHQMQKQLLWSQKSFKGFLQFITNIKKLHSWRCPDVCSYFEAEWHCISFHVCRKGRENTAKLPQQRSRSYDCEVRSATRVTNGNSLLHSKMDGNKTTCHMSATCKWMMDPLMYRTWTSTGFFLSAKARH